MVKYFCDCDVTYYLETIVLRLTLIQLASERGWVREERTFFPRKEAAQPQSLWNESAETVELARPSSKSGLPILPVLQSHQEEKGGS